MPFPYSIGPPERPSVIENKAEYIEQWLASHEAIHDESLVSAHRPLSTLRKFYPKNRDHPRVLIGLAETGLRDCLPQLDVGDAFETLGSPSLSLSAQEEQPVSEKNLDVISAVRQELIDVLSGHAVLMSIESVPEKGDVPFAPWSLRYSGHQFGSWAGQLGDGRAISIRQFHFFRSGVLPSIFF
jgi:hypothetical protein